MSGPSASQNQEHDCCEESDHPAHAVCAWIKPVEELYLEAGICNRHLRNLIVVNDHGLGFRRFRAVFPFLDAAMPKPRVNADICHNFDALNMEQILHYTHLYCAHFLSHYGRCEGGTPHLPCDRRPRAGAWLCPQHQAIANRCFFGWVSQMSYDTGSSPSCFGAIGTRTSICPEHCELLRTLLVPVQRASIAVIHEFVTLITYCQNYNQWMRPRLPMHPTRESQYVPRLEEVTRAAIQRPFSRGGTLNLCLLCLDPLHRQTSAPETRPVALIACGHVYHASCLQQWLTERQVFQNDRW